MLYQLLKLIVRIDTHISVRISTLLAQFAFLVNHYRWVTLLKNSISIRIFASVALPELTNKGILLSSSFAPPKYVNLIFLCICDVLKHIPHHWVANLCKKILLTNRRTIESYYSLEYSYNLQNHFRRHVQRLRNLCDGFHIIFSGHKLIFLILKVNLVKILAYLINKMVSTLKFSSYCRIINLLDF